MSWRIRQFFRKYGMVSLIGVLLFTGYSHVTGGGGSAGRFVRNSTRWIYSVPIAGSFLRQSRNYSRKSYISYSKGSRKKVYGKAASRKKMKARGKRSKRRGRRR